MYKNIFIVIVVFLFVGCGGSSSLSLPDWFLNKPNDPNYLFGTGTSSGPDLQTTMNDARNVARQDIAQSMGVKVKSYQERFAKQVGSGKEASLNKLFMETSKQVTSEVLTGVKERKAETKQKNEVYECFVLLEYPMGAALQAMKEQLKQAKDMQTELMKTEAMQDLDKEIDALEESRKK